MSYRLTAQEKKYLQDVILALDGYGDSGKDPYDIKWSISGSSIDAADENGVEDSPIVTFVDSMLFGLETQKVSVLKKRVLPICRTILKNLLDSPS